MTKYKDNQNKYLDPLETFGFETGTTKDDLDRASRYLDRQRKEVKKTPLNKNKIVAVAAGLAIALAGAVALNRAENPNHIPGNVTSDEIIHQNDNPSSQIVLERTSLGEPANPAPLAGESK